MKFLEAKEMTIKEFKNLQGRELNQYLTTAKNDIIRWMEKRLPASRDLNHLDVMQDVFLNLYKYIDKLDESKHINALLFTAAKHLVIDDLRKPMNTSEFVQIAYSNKQNGLKIDNSIDQSLAIEPKVDEKLDNKLKLNLIFDKLETYKKQEYVIIFKKFINGQSIKEISSEEGCSEQYVKNSVNRIRKFISKP